MRGASQNGFNNAVPHPFCPLFGLYHAFFLPRQAWCQVLDSREMEGIAGLVKILTKTCNARTACYYAIEGEIRIQIASIDTLDLDPRSGLCKHSIGMG